MASLARNVDHHSEECSLDCHFPSVGGTHVRRRRSELLERKGKATLSGHVVVGLEG